MTADDHRDIAGEAIAGAFAIFAEPQLPAEAYRKVAALLHEKVSAYLAALHAGRRPATAADIANAVGEVYPWAVSTIGRHSPRLPQVVAREAVKTLRSRRFYFSEDDVTKAAQDKCRNGII